jgi:hypothetical protein
MNDTLATEISDRLVTLADGRSGLRRTLLTEIREVSSGAPPSSANPQPILDFIASDEALDRYDEIITAAGWRLENYRRNPVFQNAHQYGDVIFTLGKALQTEVRDGRLYQRIEFATEVNPMARIAHGLYKGKFLNAVSVGFIPLRWVNGPGAGQGPSAGRGECSALDTRHAAASSSFRRKYLEQELLEVSAVGIPANPNALALGLKSGAVGKSDLRELNELIRQTLGEGKQELEEWQEVPIRKVPGVEGRGDTVAEFAELLRLAKEVRDILRKV